MKFCPSCNNTFEDQVGFCPDDGEVLRETPEDIVGRVLDGKYKVESFIAQGGMGAVYRARHILLGDSVVIKTMHSDMRDNSKWVRRFQREGRAARSFSHPNAVTVYDLSTASDGLIYLVMEYVEGQTLDKELKRRGHFSPAEAIDVLAPVANVLDAAHACGVVHRDLKPENIMISQAIGGRQSVKVLDLGIAKMMEMPDTLSEEGASLTVAGQLLGTPYYMSPEQWGQPARDGNPEVDARTDIYSLGVIFFELIAGRKPFGGRTLPEVRQQHVASALPLLHELVPSVPEAFSRAVGRAMARDRDDRQQTAGQLLAELRATFGRASITSAIVADTMATVLFEDVELPAIGAHTSEAAVRKTQSAVSAGQKKDETRVARPRLSGAAESAVAEGQAVPSTEEESSAVPMAGAGMGTTRRSNRSLIIGGALVVLLLAGGVGWLAWNRTRTKTSDDASMKPTAVNPSSAAPVMTGVLSYWIESFDQPNKGNTKRVADLIIPLVSGQNYKFYFRPSERGYLYIIGQTKAGNAPMTFLTALGDDLRKTNLAPGNAEFDFPYQGKLNLDDNPGTDEFTIIFSPTPLLAPAFLTETYRQVLTPAEVKELEDFRAQHKLSDMKQVVQTENNEDAVVVSVPGGMNDQPIIFEIYIKHE